MSTKRKKIVWFVVWALAVPVFVWSQLNFYKSAYAAENISEIEDEVEETKDELKKAEKGYVKSVQELTQINSAVYSTQSEINKTQSTLNEVKQTITRKELEIVNLEDQIRLKEEMLKNFLREIYYIKSQSTVSVVLSESNFTDMFSSVDHLLTLEEKMMNILKELARTKTQIEQDKAELADIKEQHEDVLEKKIDEKQDLLVDKAEAASVVAEKEATIEELRDKLAELESDLNVLTGKSFNAKDIKEAVEYASDKTGVPKGVLYGFLKMETNLGANTGQCTYKEVEKVAVARYKKYGSKYKASIALLYKRQELFYDLVDDLGYSKNKKVSCSPSGYVGQGGAMGVPQFMSDTWQGYKSSIAANTGHKTPDPWDLTDGVMAMALKLKKAGATSDSASAIKKASINYLGTFYANYYNGIVYWSKNYKRLFD
ncbi:MAG TPA: lytic murein transglycosylase [Candidatus Moranbacteria bacterium]|nr:lytic murein transglycosylase [Candidatus Moranbacteria bacterium]HRY27950.1 lytic murein transglycosylase [Candidatus Moranbacteria bacterium]HSA08234.1 lytic murein transglycosylase [Candidatus Moranbacteria bacterium]